MSAPPVSSPLVRRLDVQLLPDPERVVARPLLPGDYSFGGGHNRMRLLVERIVRMSDDQIMDELTGVRQKFRSRHADYRQILEDSAERVFSQLREVPPVDAPRRALVGAYFTQEVAIEAAALFNPSMVPAPESLDGGEPGRFVLSLRGTAEGHISSIEFRTGQVTSDGEVVLDTVGDHVVTGQRSDPLYNRPVFVGKLLELGADGAHVDEIVARVPSEFTMEQLQDALLEVMPEDDRSVAGLETARLVHWLASSNYVVRFDEESSISERVLMPQSSTESRGMEDARFVLFTDDDGGHCYYATYTAFDGLEILPQLIETSDFRSFRVATLNGNGAQNKGMALFPRRVGGSFMALSRNDRESLFLMSSDSVHWWHDPQILRRPTHPWELFQIGNCGSPIETEAGWLVLTHGVGAMRRYAIGAVLLDLEDPARIIGDLPEPLLEPAPGERNGYVPNVVYSCGGMTHAGKLILPYGFSDYACRFASVELDGLLEALVASPPKSS